MEELQLQLLQQLVEAVEAEALLFAEETGAVLTGEVAKMECRQGPAPISQDA